VLTPKSNLDFQLNMELSTPEQNLSDYSIWLYGAPKIGKTSLSSMFGDTYHLMFERGAKALRIRQSLIEYWPHFEAAIRKLQGIAAISTITVDVLELAYSLCFSHMCKQMKITHPNDVEDFGKSWGMIRDEFLRVLMLLSNIGKGVIYVSHASLNKRKTLAGTEVRDVHPALTGKPLEFVEGAMDIIGYCHVRRGQRVIQIRQDDEIMAGCRLDENFRHSDGSPVVYIPMGSSKHEAYDNFMLAFNNQLPPPEKKETKKLPRKLKKAS
jgi:hypothetical protein